MVAEDFHDIREYSQQKFNSDRERFLTDAIKNDDGGWTKHSEYHWSRMLKNHKLDYWPSRNKFQYRGKVRRGDIYGFIKRNSPSCVTR